jgi:hypothetical protein
MVGDIQMLSIPDRRTFQVQIHNYGDAVAVDANGYVYVAGRADSMGNYYTLTIKYAPNGTEMWNVTTQIAFSASFAYGISTTSNGTSYVAGYYASGASGTDDMLLLKYDTDGNEIWSITEDGGSNDYGYGVAATNDSVYVAGSPR